MQQDSPTPPMVDVARLVGALQADPQPRLTWYGEDGARVELTGRVLAQWVAKTAHLLAEEADVAPGSRVGVALGPDWRAPVFWLAAWYLGADLTSGADAGTDTDTDADVRVVREGAPAAGTGITVVVGASALPRPVADLPAGAVDYGAEVSGQPDQLPMPGPATRVRTAVSPGGRVLLGPGTDPAHVLGTWAAGGSVVLHIGLDAALLARVAAQENVSDG